MDAKTYLRQLTHLDKDINALLERRERYEAMAMRRTGVYSGGLPGTQRRNSSVETYACKLVDLAREIDRKIDRYVDLTREAEALIEAISDIRYRRILKYRYLNGWSWEEIARSMGYDNMKWLWRLHGFALKSLDFSRLPPLKQDYKL
jgi:3-methyladenine DNA glycosylase/8-oxoguanine DNA glycosylase